MPNNDYEEYYYSEELKDVENEKKKRETLMLFFPQAMGTIDKTHYILQVGGKTKENDNCRISSSNLDKPKRRKDCVDLENNENAFNFGDIDDCFKSNREYTRKKELACDKNVAFGVIMHQLNKIENLSCGIDSLIQNKDDGKGKVKCRGIHPKYNYTQEINKLKQQLPLGVQGVLANSGTDIRVLDDLHVINEKGLRSEPNGIYTSNKIRLDSKHVDFETLLAESIHAIQDNLGMTGNGISKLEFQEHVLKDIFYYYKYEFENAKWKGLSASDSKEYFNFITKIFDINGVLDLNQFVLGISSYFDKFQENYSKSNSYQQSGKNEKELDYKWSYFFDILGIQYK